MKWAWPWSLPANAILSINVRLIVAYAAFALVLDQATKLAVIWGLNLAERGVIEVFPPLLRFHMAWNRGINFGIFSNHSELGRFFLVAIAFVVCIGVLYWVRGPQISNLTKAFAGLLVGGALGNIIDRLVYGAVADFLNVTCCGIDNPYAFNIADGAIFIGAIGLAATGPDSPKPQVRDKEKPKSKPPKP
ncbi:MAG: signal peptidase II [Paracoccaceae bacterium]|jgi:signal peptidase II